MTCLSAYLPIHRSKQASTYHRDRSTKREEQSDEEREANKRADRSRLAPQSLSLLLASTTPQPDASSLCIEYRHPISGIESWWSGRCVDGGMSYSMVGIRCSPRLASPRLQSIYRRPNDEQTHPMSSEDEHRSQALTPFALHCTLYALYSLM